MFRDDTDRRDYLDRLARYHDRFGIRLYAFCLMSNHVHLAVEQGRWPLAVFMHALQSSYTQYFNRRHRRIGHLFQGRYKSVLVDRDRYLLALIRYIHENPVKAGITTAARFYPWSSERFFRRGQAPPWFDLARALDLLGSNRGDVIAEGKHDQSAPSYEEIPLHEGSVKGGEDFATLALRPVSRDPRGRRRWTAEEIARVVGAYDGLTPADLAGSSRRRVVSQSRVMSAYLGRENFGVPVAEFARLFRRNETTLGRVVRSFQERLRREADLRERVDRVARTAEF